MIDMNKLEKYAKEMDLPLIEVFNKSQIKVKDYIRRDSFNGKSINYMDPQPQYERIIKVMEYASNRYREKN